MSEEAKAAERPYLTLKAHYESCFKTHGDTHKGMDWPNAEDAIKRFDIMLDIIDSSDISRASVLDIGCGSGHLLEYMLASKQIPERYCGIDISEVMINQAIMKHPDTNFQCLDLLDQVPEDILTQIGSTDYVIMNGIFCEKRDMTQSQMDAFLEAMLKRAFALCRKGMAFNVMSAHVDWQREDLYHLPYDRMAQIIMGIAGRRHSIRADYGLYEYTVYAYR